MRGLGLGPILVLTSVVLLGSEVVSKSSAESFDAPWERVEVIRRAGEEGEIHSTLELNSITNITVYVTTFCDQCDQVVKFLKENEIKFDEKFIIPTPAILGGLLAQGNDAPITKLTYRDGSSRRISGFDREILSSLIKKEERLPSGDSFEISEFELP